MKLQRFIVETAVLARRKAITAIEEGRVTVNGETVITPYSIIDPKYHRIVLDGKLLKIRQTPEIVLVLNKPPGYLVADSDEKERPLVKDLFKKKIKIRLFPVGRLDFNSQGLIIYTNNGELVEKLSHPRNQIPRVYRVKIHGIPQDTHLKKMRRGLFVPGLGHFPGCSIRIERETGKNSWLVMTIHQGRNREIRKLFDHFRYPVIKLIRTCYGPFAVTGIPTGGYVVLNDEQKKDLRQYVDRSPKRHKGKTSKKKGKL